MTNENDLINREAALACFHDWVDRNGDVHTPDEMAEYRAIEGLPSVQPEPYEITDEQAILHLQSTGWMQNHDREMYESGLREQLADDSRGYDSVIPCEDTISRQEAIHIVDGIDTWQAGWRGNAIESMKALPSVQPDIIRCKDCKFYSPMNRETKTGICNLTMHQNFGDDWFCAGAERREE